MKYINQDFNKNNILHLNDLVLIILIKVIYMKNLLKLTIKINIK